MDTTTTEMRGVDIVEIHGKVVGDVEACHRFHELFQSMLEKGRKQFVVDLQDAPWASSLGIGMLIAAYASVKNRGGDLVLAGATDRIKDVLEVTHLFNVFKTFDAVEDAVDHLGAKTAAKRPPVTF